jgi:hypothetical protein
MKLLPCLKFLVPAAIGCIVLTDEECRRVAAIAAEAPRLSWASGEYNAGSFQTRYIDVTPNRSFLICYPLDRIPKGQRITNAEWEIPVLLTSAGEQHFHVRRIVGDWGPGVCYTYRATRPEKIPWSVPGGLGSALDRALNSGGTMRANGPGHCTLNVTEDVQLWYSGAAANQGWILNGEVAGALVRLHSPLAAGQGQWKLRITYEPE